MGSLLEPSSWEGASRQPPCCPPTAPVSGGAGVGVGHVDCAGLAVGGWRCCMEQDGWQLCQHVLLGISEAPLGFLSPGFI